MEASSRHSVQIVGTVLDMFRMQVPVQVLAILVQSALVLVDVSLILFAILVVLVKISLVRVDVTLVLIAVGAILLKGLLVLPNILPVGLNILRLWSGILALGIRRACEQARECKPEHTSSNEMVALHFSLS